MFHVYREGTRLFSGEPCLVIWVLLTSLLIRGLMQVEVSSIFLLVFLFCLAFSDIQRTSGFLLITCFTLILIMLLLGLRTVGLIILLSCGFFSCLVHYYQVSVLVSHCSSNGYVSFCFFLTFLLTVTCVLHSIT